MTSQVANWKASIASFSIMLPRVNSNILSIDYACTETTYHSVCTSQSVGLLNTTCSLSYKFTTHMWSSKHMNMQFTLCAHSNSMPCAIQNKFQ